MISKLSTISSLHPTLAELTLGPIHFQREVYLLLIPILALLTIFIARKSISGLGKSSRIAALIVRLLAIALIGFGLAGYIGGRLRTDTPILHGGAGAVLAFVVAQAIGIAIVLEICLS